MPPKRRAGPAASPAKKRKSTRRTQEPVEDDIPEVFQEMLAEAVASSATGGSHPPAFIGRRLASEEPEDELASNAAPSLPEEATPSPSEPQPQAVQMIFDDFEESEDDDVEFEDIDLDPNEVDDIPEQKPLKLDLSASAITPRRLARRKVASGAERRLRLDVHKAHLLLLISALQHRNQWCENEQVQLILKPLVSRKIINMIHVDDAKPQAERSRSFTKGLEALIALWRNAWTVTARGMKRAHWRDNINIEDELDEIEDSIDFEAFKAAAHSCSGSRDLGAQLFCALLRSIAIDTRLVCSLQVLPFSAVAKDQTPEKPRTTVTHAPAQDFGSSSSAPSTSKFTESAYPIYWVEVFSPSTSTWLPLDPLIRNTINKPRTAFEPPASDQLNALSYVIAFEDDGSAKDVTRRYTNSFNAKTRKTRVESTRGGEEWWARVTSYFEKSLPEVRDELEDAEFLRRGEQEGMPKNVSDFKGHPVYVLERHLRRNEVIYPKREVGKATVGLGMGKKLESVFRRRDVHLCRTSEAWYRRGRDVREGMEPLKYTAPRTRLEREELGFDEEDEQSEGMALYAEYQTEVYVPPPVVDGLIPRNKFGNLDVYVDSMVPAGGIHVRHPLAAKAAEVLGIIFAQAVTGFEFKGRQGTAVINGVVVSEQQRIAMVTVLVGLQTQAVEEIESERSRITLAVWKKWYRALQIRDRLEREYGDKDTNNEMDLDEAEDNNSSTYQDEDDGGGFMPDAENSHSLRDPKPAAESLGKAMVLPPLPAIPEYHEIVVIESPHRLPKPVQSAHEPTTKPSTDTTQGAGGFMQQDNGGRVFSATHDEDAEISGGGFMIDDEEEDIVENLTDTNGISNDEAEIGGGGFLPEDNGDDADEISARTGSAHTPNITVPDFKRTLAAASHTPFAPDEPKIIAQAPPLPENPSNTEIETHVEGKDKEQHDDQEESDKDSLMGSDTSMLSHDPDEEDAEPEWLIDSLS